MKASLLTQWMEIRTHQGFERLTQLANAGIVDQRGELAARVREGLLGQLVDSLVGADIGLNSECGACARQCGQMAQADEPWPCALSISATSSSAADALALKLITTSDPSSARAALRPGRDAL